MDKRSLPLVATIAALAVVLAGVGIFWKTHARLGTHFYPKGRETLEISETLTAAQYRSLSEQLPGTNIVCDISFQRKTIPSDTKEITVTRLSREDIPFLQALSNLETVHAEECTDYAPLEYLSNRMPECKVYYGVELDGIYYDQSTETIWLPNPDMNTLAKLEHLPKLKMLDVTGCMDAAKLVHIYERYPQWQLVYTVPLSGMEIPHDTVDLELTGAEYQELKDGLLFLPQLKTLTLHNPAMSQEELAKLAKDYQNIEIRMEISCAGQVLDESVTELDLTDRSFGSLGEVEEILTSAAYVPTLKKVVIQAGGFTNEELAQLRERYLENCELVWTVRITSKISLRTDVTAFAPSAYGDYSFANALTENLAYCTRMEAMNLSSTSLKNVDFIKNMPELKYLDLNGSQVTDLSGLSECRKLVLLNLADTTLKDTEPLLGCTALEDLNISRTGFRTDSVAKMTWLKNLYAVGRGGDGLKVLKDGLKSTKIEVSAGAGWWELQNYKDYKAYFG